MAEERMTIEVLFHDDATPSLIVSGCVSDIADRLHAAIPCLTHETELVGWSFGNEEVNYDDGKCMYVYYKDGLRIAFYVEYAAYDIVYEGL